MNARPQSNRPTDHQTSGSPGAPDARLECHALRVAGPEGPIAATLWVPQKCAGGRPLVLLGSAGALHREEAYLARLIERLVGAFGYAALTISFPHYGERTPPRERGLSLGQRREMVGVDAWRERNTAAAPQALAEMQAAIDAAQALQNVGAGPVAYFGLSAGTRFGVPLLARDPRVVAGVIGLFGWSDAPELGDFNAAARGLQQPLLYLQQLDDEVYRPANGMHLFAAFGSREKTMLAHPGSHAELPASAVQLIVAFLAEHLGPASV